jgi:hypothetical protein
VEQDKKGVGEDEQLRFLKGPRSAWSQAERERAFELGDAREKMARLISAVVADAPAVGGQKGIGVLLQALHSKQIGVELNRDRASGAIVGMSYTIGSTRIKGSDLGPEFTWKGLERAGFTYNAERDKAAVEAGVTAAAARSKAARATTNVVTEPERPQAQPASTPTVAPAPSVARQEPATPPQQAAAPREPQAEVVLESKLLLIEGDCREARDALKALGARWDPNRAAWTFPLMSPSDAKEATERISKILGANPATATRQYKFEIHENKQLVVKGDTTREHHDELRQLGGHFNPVLMAWTFTPSKRAAVEPLAQKYGWTVTEALAVQPMQTASRQTEPRSLLLKGENTRDHREELKRFGGRFNPEQGGWVFPLDRRSELTPLAAQRNWSLSEIDTPAPSRALLVKGKVFESMEFLKEVGGQYNKTLHGFVVPIASEARVVAYAKDHGLQVKEIGGGKERLTALVDRAANNGHAQGAPTIER